MRTVLYLTEHLHGGYMQIWKFVRYGLKERIMWHETEFQPMPETMRQLTEDLLKASAEGKLEKACVVLSDDEKHLISALAISRFGEVEDAADKYLEQEVCTRIRSI